MAMKLRNEQRQALLGKHQGQGNAGVPGQEARNGLGVEVGQDGQGPAPARAKAGSTSRAVSASRAENTRGAKASSGVQGSTFRAPKPPWAGPGMRQAQASP